jgi:methionyl-tRNA formyltransferase
VGDIVFFTARDKTPVLAALLDAGERVSAVVVPPKAVGGQLDAVDRFCTQHQIPLFKSERVQIHGLLKRLRPSVLLSCGYMYLFSEAELSVASYNLNIHPTLLPQYRGPATAWHVIASGERTSGVTVHFIDASVDTGPIVYQESIVLSAFDTVKSLMRKTSALEPIAAIEALKRVRRGAKGTPQGKGFAILSKRTPKDSEFDPSLPLSELYDFIRACDPQRFPAFFYRDGVRVGIKLFRLEKPADEEDLI